MSEKLFESELFTVKTSIWTKSSAQADTNPANETSNTSAGEADSQLGALPNKGEWKAWGELLQSRLAANRKLSAEAKEPEFELESKFFKEFFSTNWDELCAQQLILMGDPLKKLLRVVGFDPATNPVLAFLLLPFVTQNLLQTKLLNVNTFKAIYNAFVKKIVADSQFEKENTYNIIYCVDLYKRSPKEIEEYLALQKHVLSPSASIYKVADQIKNRKIFFELFSEADINKVVNAFSTIDNAKVPIAKAAKLNSIERARALAEKLGARTVPNETNLNNKEMSDLINKLDTIDKKMAAILALSMSTESAEAKKAVMGEKFNGIDMRKLVAGAIQLVPSLSKGKLATKDADALVKALLSSI